MLGLTLPQDLGTVDDWGGSLEDSLRRRTEHFLDEKQKGEQSSPHMSLQKQTASKIVNSIQRQHQQQGEYTGLERNNSKSSSHSTHKPIDVTQLGSIEQQTELMLQLQLLSTPPSPSGTLQNPLFPSLSSSNNNRSLYAHSTVSRDSSQPSPNNSQFSFDRPEQQQQRKAQPVKVIRHIAEESKTVAHAMPQSPLSPKVSSNDGSLQRLWSLKGMAFLNSDPNSNNGARGSYTSSSQPRRKSQLSRTSINSITSTLSSESSHSDSESNNNNNNNNSSNHDSNAAQASSTSKDVLRGLGTIGLSQSFGLTAVDMELKTPAKEFTFSDAGSLFNQSDWGDGGGGGGGAPLSVPTGDVVLADAYEDSDSESTVRNPSPDKDLNVYIKYFDKSMPEGKQQVQMPTTDIHPAYF
jgi:hypothetical protein